MTDNQNKETGKQETMCRVHKKAHKELHKRAYQGLEAYVDCQKKVDNILIKGALGKGSFKKLDKWFSKMAILNNYVSEVAKTYRVIFQEDMDIEEMTGHVVKEKYPQLYKAVLKRRLGKDADFRKFMSDNGHDMSKARVFDFEEGANVNDLPEDLREFGTMMMDSLKKAGKENVKMRFVDMSNGQGFDFPHIPKNDKELKEMMTENVIRHAEEEAHIHDEPDTQPGKAARDSHKSGSANPKKDKLN